MGGNRSAIITKRDLIASTTSAWDALVAYVDGVPDEQWTGPKDAAGWSVKDHVSHLTNWDRAVIALLRNKVPLQETLGISAAAWSAGSYDPMNEEIRQLTVNDSVNRVKADRDITWTDLLALLNELSDEQLARPAGEVGLVVGQPALNPSARSESVLQVLVDWCGSSYAEHFRYITTLVEGQSATQPR